MATPRSPYALQCCIERDDIRNFRAMLQCLDRFGKDLFLECNAQEVTLRTLNAAQSAFILFTLRTDFFGQYVVSALPPNEPGPDPTLPHAHTPKCAAARRCERTPPRRSGCT